MADLDDSDSHRPNEAHLNRVKVSIENWKRKLLDLTKRNRALNFRMNKVSTIAIVDEQPAEVFRHLYIQERAMRFKAAPDKDEQIGLISNEPAPETEDLTKPLENAVPAGVDNTASVLSGNATLPTTTAAEGEEDED